MPRPANGPTGEERRCQIIDAASRVFARKGYTGATTKDIARAAGVTHAAIYHYFRDKRALFEEVLTAHDPLARAAEQVLAAAADEEPRAVLLRLVRAMIGELEQSDDLPVFQVMTSEALRDPDVAAIGVALRRPLIDALAAYLRTQQARGRLRPLDPNLAAQLILGNLINCVVRRTLHHDPAMLAYAPEQIATAYVAMVLGGMEAPVPGENTLASRCIDAGADIAAVPAPA